MYVNTEVSNFPFRYIICLNNIFFRGHNDELWSIIAEFTLFYNNLAFDELTQVLGPHYSPVWAITEAMLH